MTRLPRSDHTKRNETKQLTPGTKVKQYQKAFTSKGWESTACTKKKHTHVYVYILIFNVRIKLKVTDKKGRCTFYVVFLRAPSSDGQDKGTYR